MIPHCLTMRVPGWNSSQLEVSRLLEIVRHALSGTEATDPVDVRAMASEVARLASRRLRNAGCTAAKDLP